MNLSTIVKRALLGLVLLSGVTAAVAEPAQTAPRPVTAVSSRAIQGDAPTGAACEEDFEDIPSLYSENGWLRINHSGGADAPVTPFPVFWISPTSAEEPPGWPSNLFDFGAQSGSPNSRVLSTGVGLAGIGETLSSWLLTPPIQFQSGSTLTFWTRSVADNFGGGQERLVVRVCSTGDCTEVGEGPDDVGDYTTTLLAINESALNGNSYCGAEDPVDCPAYPTNWRQYTVTLPASGTGRVAFHHYTPYVGVFGGEGVQIGLDTVAVHNAGNCPFLHNRLFADSFEVTRDPGAITQNNDNQTVADVLDLIVWECWTFADNGGFYTRNAYLRRFNLNSENGLVGRVAITSIDIGIQFTSSSQYIPVRLYSIPVGAELAYENMSLVGQTEMEVGGSEQAIIRNVPITAVLDNAETSELVFEISPEYGDNYLTFFPGMNAAGQTAPTYYSGACQITEGGTPVGSSIVDITQLLGGTSSSGHMYTPDDSLVVTLHTEERPAESEPANTSH